MLKDQIQDDLKAAMIAKDAARLSAIRMLKSAIQYFEIQKGGASYEATDEDVVEVAGREIKKRRESIELYKQAGRDDSAANEEAEIKVLENYLPAQMSEDEIRKIVDETIKQTGASSPQEMGKVMGALMPKVKGKADSTVVSNLVREALSQ
ncbi:MAG TPA: GatB/YqeY domain-containing protein [Patescibacteria group bacterium]|nr:GatB/YqeY domain-containing protein [Patescibacteria group bacterium]